MIVADTFTNLSAQYLGADALPSQRPFVLLVTGVLVLLMCFPRNLQALGEQQHIMSQHQRSSMQPKPHCYSASNSGTQSACLLRICSMRSEFGWVCNLHRGGVDRCRLLLHHAERVSFLAVLGFIYTACAVLVRGSQVRQ